MKATREMIKKMQGNDRIYMSLNGDERACLKENIKDLLIPTLNGDWIRRNHTDELSPSVAYRIRPLGELPVAETKLEQIERLKVNKLPFCDLNASDQALLNELRKGGMIFGSTARINQFYECSGNWVYHIHRDYKLPVEVPEGYRLVSMEDRKRCAYPEDCVVKWMSSGAFLRSTSGCGWVFQDLAFAIPADYTFAEDWSKKEVLKLVPFDVVDKGGTWTVDFGSNSPVPKGCDNDYVSTPIHECVSIVGFAGFLFEGGGKSKPCMSPARYTSNSCCSFMKQDDSYKIDKPIKALFEVTVEE
jgi:hypothetical protein